MRNILSIAAFLLSAHSLVMAIVVMVNPDWYIDKAYAAGVKPSVGRAIAVKLVLAVFAAGVGMWFL